MLSPKQAKPLDKLPMNPTKGVWNILWNVSRKVKLVPQVPGSIFFILCVKILHHKSVCNNAF